MQGTWKSPVEALIVNFADLRDLPVPPSSKSYYYRNVDIMCVTSLSTATAPGTQQGLTSYSSCLIEMHSKPKFLFFILLKETGGNAN